MQTKEPPFFSTESSNSLLFTVFHSVSDWVEAYRMHQWFLSCQYEGLFKVLIFPDLPAGFDTIKSVVILEMFFTLVGPTVAFCVYISYCSSGYLFHSFLRALLPMAATQVTGSLRFVALSSLHSATWHKLFLFPSWDIRRIYHLSF